jgi:hypothetical protein
MALLGALQNKWQRFRVPVHSLVLGGSNSGPLIEADSTRVKIPGLTLGSTAITATPAQINSLAAVTGVPVEAALVSYTENGAGTYTGSVVVPAGALIHDIKVWSTVLWTAATSAVMKVGDTDDDGWFTGIDLKATDLLVGEEINFENFGGKQGVYLVAATGLRSAAYSASARTIAGIVTSVGAGTAGRTFMLVTWSKPTATAATKV